MLASLHQYVDVMMCIETVDHALNELSVCA